MTPAQRMVKSRNGLLQGVRGTQTFAWRGLQATQIRSINQQRGTQSSTSAGISLG